MKPGSWLWLRRLAIPAVAFALLILLRVTACAPARIPVRVVSAESGLVEQTVTNSRAGTVKARRRAKLSPEIGGRVVALPLRKNDRVRAGAIVLRIDDATQRAQVNLARRESEATAAQREQACLVAERARREHARVARLAAEGVASPDLLDQLASQDQTAAAACRAAGATAQRAEAAADLAAVELAKTILHAPFDGIVGDVMIEVGEWTSPAPPAMPIPPVIDLIDTGSIDVSAPMDEVDAARIRPGQKARVTVDSFPGRRFAGHVARVAPYVLDRLEQNRTIEIEVTLDDAAEAARLLPGMSADAEVILEERHDVVRLPTSALFEGGQVLTVEGGRLVERTVTVGLKNWDFTEIASGLTPGERVVAAIDRPEIKAGARVRVTTDTTEKGRP